MPTPSPEIYMVNIEGGGTGWIPVNDGGSSSGGGSSGGGGGSSEPVDPNNAMYRLVLDYHGHNYSAADVVLSAEIPNTVDTVYAPIQDGVVNTAMLADCPTSITATYNNSRDAYFGYYRVVEEGYTISDYDHVSTKYAGQTVTKTWRGGRNGTAYIDCWTAWVTSGIIIYHPGTLSSYQRYRSRYKTAGTALTLPDGWFTRDGYIQNGWTKTDGGAKQYDFGDSYTPSNGSVEFMYPSWEEYTPPGTNFTITIHPNGATGEDIVLTVEAGAEVVIPDDSTYSRNGYHLSVWNESPDGDGSSWIPGETYIFERGADVELYAIWLGDEYMVHYADRNPSNRYHRYNGRAYHFDWTSQAGTVYSGTLDVVTGVLTVDRASVLFDGTQAVGLTNWMPNSSSVGWLYAPSVTPGLLNVMIDSSNLQSCGLLSDTLETVVYGGSTGVYGETSPCISLVGSTHWGIAMRLNDTTLTTAAKINEYLSANPIRVIYKLATPVTYQLTPQEIISLQENHVFVDEASATIDDISYPDPGLPFTLLKVSVHPSQDLHGYANPWPAGGGVNKLLPRTEDYSGTTTYGINYSYSLATETLTVSGTNTDASAHVFYSQQVSAGHVKISANPTAGDTYYFGAELPSGMYAQIVYTKSGGGVAALKFINASGYYSGTIPNDFAGFYRFDVGVNPSATISGNCRFIFTIGSTAPTSWTPYENICPISGLTGLSVYRTGKNLLENEELFTYSNWSATVAPNGDMASGGTNKIYSLPILADGKTYTISFDFNGDTFPTYLYFGRYKDGTSNRLAYITTSNVVMTSYTFTAEAGYTYCLRMGSTLDESYFDGQIAKWASCQLELGSTANSEYENVKYIHSSKAVIGEPFYTDRVPYPDGKEYCTFDGWVADDDTVLTKADAWFEAYSYGSDPTWTLQRDLVVYPRWTPYWSSGKVFFGGMYSDDCSIRVEEPPSYIWPEYSYAHDKVYGKSGDILRDNGRYENVSKKYKISAYDGTNFFNVSRKVSEWLHRKGPKMYMRLEDSYEPDIYMMAVYEESNELDNLLATAGKCEITFNCMPQKFLLSGDVPIDITQSGQIVTNPTSNPAFPIITFSGAGNIYINGKAITVADNFNIVNFHTDSFNAFDIVGRNMNGYIYALDSLILDPGENVIEYDGYISDLKITPRWWRV